ncbi:MAG TPA: hypothetical protein VFY04_08530 [Solirubrobacterales bacterium]|nr:hypothetical protein [Solirubrobacterales bacterium]
MPDPAEPRLADFLRSPRETQDRELKRWLDLSEPANRGKVARHLMALANFGGGWLQFGFKEESDGSFAHERTECPDPSRYSTDAVNAIVRRHAEPRFHCEVHWQSCNEGCPGPHALIRVPGGDKVPIVCSKGGPGPKNDPEKGAVYDRLPGPESSKIIEPNHWHDLLERCLQARHDALVESVRDAIELLGRRGLARALGAEVGSPTSDGDDVLGKWTADSRVRLDQLLHEQSEYARLYEQGWWSVSYAVDPPPDPPLQLRRLKDLILSTAGRETGWPAWRWPSSSEHQPRLNDDVIECWMAGGVFTDAAHADFWRASTKGLFYLLRGYDEDAIAELSPRHSSIAPGSMLDPGIAVWRIGECVLHAERMCRQLNAEKVHFDIRWEGLSGRRISVLEPARRDYWSGPSQDDNASVRLTIDRDLISSTLPKIVHELTTPLFVHFDFFEMPLEDVNREMSRMRGQPET